jgi:hypothetical protein
LLVLVFFKDDLTAISLALSSLLLFLGHSFETFPSDDARLLSLYDLANRHFERPRGLISDAHFELWVELLKRFDEIAYSHDTVSF